MWGKWVWQGCGREEHRGCPYREVPVRGGGQMVVWVLAGYCGISQDGWLEGGLWLVPGASGLY